MAADAVLFAIDPYPAGRLGLSFPMLVAQREVGRVSNGAVKWIRQTGEAAVAGPCAKQTFDFVFIDGEHTYEALRSDWIGWSTRLEPGGKICLHDSRSSLQRPIDHAGSVRFTNESILLDPHFEVVETVDSLTVLVLKANGSLNGSKTSIV